MRVHQRSVYLGVVAWLALHLADPEALVRGQGVAHSQSATGEKRLANDNHIGLIPPMVTCPSGLTTNPLNTQPAIPDLNRPTATASLLDMPWQATSQPQARMAGLPFAALPMTQNHNSSGPTSAKSQLSVAAMTGPMTDPMALFSDLKTQTPTPGPLASPLRGDNTDMTWSPATYTWYTPTFAHRPLYFEQPNLERYGIGTYRWLQPAASSAHFFASISLMPYKVMTQHPRESVYSLGYDRPGNCAAYQGRPLVGQSRVGETLKYWDSCSGYQ